MNFIDTAQVNFLNTTQHAGGVNTRTKSGE